MRPTEREEWIKLDMLLSLARSQKALARIIESVADTVATYPPRAENVMENIEAISRYQRALMQKISGLKIRKRKFGIPAKPWLSVKLKHQKLP